MKEKQETAVTLNGIRFTPEMMGTLQEWYASPKEEEHIPFILIEFLEDVQRYLIKMSEIDMEEEDKNIMTALRRLLFVIDHIRPFTEGGRHE